MKNLRSLNGNGRGGLTGKNYEFTSCNNKRTIFTIILVVLFFFLPLSANIKDYQLPDEFGYETVRIKRYLSNDYDRFDDHVDVGNHASSRRFLAFFVYLNNVEEGGETEFLNIYKPGTYIKFKINPKAGRMVVFPPLWNWPHAGRKPVTGEKYLLHSYLHYV